MMFTKYVSYTSLCMGGSVNNYSNYVFHKFYSMSVLLNSSLLKLFTVCLYFLNSSLLKLLSNHIFPMCPLTLSIKKNILIKYMQLGRKIT